MDTKHEQIYRECEAYFNRNYPTAEASERNWYLAGVIDVIQRLERK